MEGGRPRPTPGAQRPPRPGMGEWEEFATGTPFPEPYPGFEFPEGSTRFPGIPDEGSEEWVDPQFWPDSYEEFDSDEYNGKDFEEYYDSEEMGIGSYESYEWENKKSDELKELGEDLREEIEDWVEEAVDDSEEASKSDWSKETGEKSEEMDFGNIMKDEIEEWLKDSKEDSRSDDSSSYESKSHEFSDEMKSDSHEHRPGLPGHARESHHSHSGSHSGSNSSEEMEDGPSLRLALPLAGLLILIIFFAVLICVVARKRRYRKSRYEVMENESSDKPKKYLPDVCVAVPVIGDGLEKGSVMPTEGGGNFYMIATEKGIVNPTHSIKS